jgi:excisionase family DNA binding protein
VADDRDLIPAPGPEAARKIMLAMASVVRDIRSTGADQDLVEEIVNFAGAMTRAAMGGHQRTTFAASENVRDGEVMAAPYLTYAQAAHVVGTDERTVRRWCEAEQLPVIRIGRVCRIARADLDTYLESNKSRGH